jgi:hypothetical protein
MNKPAVRDIEAEEPLEAVDAGSEFIPEEDEVPMDDVTDEDGQDVEVSA